MEYYKPNSLDIKAEELATKYFADMRLEMGSTYYWSCIKS